MKRWIMGVVVGAALLIGGALGIAIGVRLNPELADRYILNLGDVGTWFGALITAATAGIAIWISVRAESRAIQAEQAEREDVELKQRVWPGLIMFEIVNMGRLPAFVQGVLIVHEEFPGRKIDLGNFYADGNGPITRKLEHREVLQIPLLTNDWSFAGALATTFESQDKHGMSLLIRTSVAEYSGDGFELSDEFYYEVNKAKFIRADVDGRSAGELQLSPGLDG